MRYFIVCLLLFGSPFLYAQLHDYNWMMGYSGGEGTDTTNEFGLMWWRFEDENLQILDHQHEGQADLWENNVSYSDGLGELFLYFDGKSIYNKEHAEMEGGNDWNPNGEQSGWFSPQAGLALDLPGSDSLIALINTHYNSFDLDAPFSLAGENLFFSVISKNANGEDGKVLIRKEIALLDTLDFGKLSACRHANGRDWWVLVPRYTFNEIHRFLLSPVGFEYLGLQEIGGGASIGLGQAFFTPDGMKHIRYHSIGGGEGDHLSIYDFNRCTGLLSNPRNEAYEKIGFGGGGTVGHGSRYLYLGSGIHLYQYDLWADDILSSRALVAEYDGFIDFNPTTFYQSQRGPDGKIYICGGVGTRFMHVIHNPNTPCPDCRIEQRGVELPTFNLGSVPNFPNYRLGPIDGSPCDTLGIDNIPLSRWRYEQDTLTPFTVQFYDLSDYEPATWSWDFGEGSSSMDTLPAHTFPGPGTYEVCLTVSNANGSDTKCKTLEFTEPVTTTEQAETAPLATAFPNPFRERFSLSLRAGWLPVQANAVVYDVMGRPVLTQRLSAGFNTLDLSGHPAGVYTWRLEEQGRVLEVGKVVKIGNR
ncbi:PKD domain-containing protein [Phaeodactylibacter xiamenensis]|uniref:PKD domain-containing protein n=2 Tax=Phaeodactylibacter xiamenensis TaxID=1524460 RepID=UPI003BACCF50